jgi:murein DD-endopeptidase MepM/ murein hydrolase activator NlpD
LGQLAIRAGEGTAANGLAEQEYALGSPRRVLQDYKPEDSWTSREVRRAPWFAAGLGIPLIAVGFIGPKDSQPPLESAAAAPVPLAPQTEAMTPSALQEITLPYPDAAQVADPAPTPVEVGSELTLEIRRGDSLDRLFRKNDLNRGDLAALMNLDLARRHLRLVKPGDRLWIRHDQGRILALSRDLDISRSLSVRRVEDAYEAEIVNRELEALPVRTSGRISSSLFEAAAEAGVSDRTIMNLAGIFAWDIDFVLDIRQGDEFTLIYEELWRNDQRVAEGHILAAEFVNQGERFRALRFETEDGRVDYFTPEGRSVRKAFVRAPVSFSRVSSNFNPRRRHPKLNTIRAHRGVDYAAPTGTPIKAAGDGKLIFRGRNGGYGNTVILQHGGNITTLYAHLSRFSRARNGSRVQQGDVIGYVGATGLATGPHLHYEYRRNGVHLNPRTVDLPEAEPIDPTYLDEFRLAAEQLLLELDGERSIFAAGTANTST